MQRVFYFCPDLTKIEFFLQIWVKVLNTKLYEKPRPVGVSLFCAQEREEGHGQPNSRFEQPICERASKSLVKKGSLRAQTGLIFLTQDRC